MTDTIVNGSKPADPNKVERTLTAFFGWGIAIYGTSMFVQLFVAFTLFLISISLARRVFEFSERIHIDTVSLIAAIVAGLLFAIYWEIRKPKPEDLERYHYWIRVVLRYILAYIFFEYGFAKLFKQQFYTNLSTLDQPLGEISGIQLAWRFFGYSYYYTVFIALSQIACAILLLFPRTATLGAAMLLPIISNIVFINFTHNIPVKAESITLLVMVLYLLLSDFRKLKATFWDHRPVPTRPYTMRTPRKAFTLIKCFMILIFLSISFAENLNAYRIFVTNTTPLYGAWTVVDYQVNGVSEDPNSDKTAWRKIYFESDRILTVKTGSGRPREYESETRLDLNNKSIRLIDLNTDDLLIEGNYDSPATGQLLVTGTNGKDNLRVTLKREP